MLQFQGVTNPTPTNALIAQKAADLVPPLKSLYEMYTLVMTVGILFANSGAGSYVIFPHTVLDTSYNSTGCDWMRKMNPYDPTKPIASEDLIRRCHPKNASVPKREYNALERGWCSEQALFPERVHTVGPYLDAWRPHLWLVTMGRAVYDRHTNEFVACMLIDVSVDQVLNDLLAEVPKDASLYSLIRWDEKGTVVASPNWNSKKAMDTVTVDQLNIGLDEAGYLKMKNLVNFTGLWDPKEARKSFEKYIYKNDEKRKWVSSFPVPPVPDKYDPNYFPEFMVLLSMDDTFINQAADELDELIKNDVMNVVMLALISGVTGLAVILLLVLAMSFFITSPLQWIDHTAKQIVESFGRDLDGNIDFEGANKESASTICFNPHTELNDLVEEFCVMIKNFSGKGAHANVVKISIAERCSTFSFLYEFKDLYFTRRDPGFNFEFMDRPIVREGDISDIPRCCHFGPNQRSSEKKSQAIPEAPEFLDRKKVYSSPLFRWIILLIVTPLIVTSITISAIGIYRLSNFLPLLGVSAEKALLDLVSSSLKLTVSLRAVFATETMNRAVRDLHVLTRFSGWLLFGAIRRSESFTDMVTAAERCKSSHARNTCDYYNETLTPRDPWQKLHFEGQSQDAWPNGNRNKSNYPDVDSTPNETSWWSDMMEVPGHEKGVLAAGYETTYDRLRTISPVSIVQIPLFNTNPSKDRLIATFIGFEADGMFIGFDGGGREHADMAFWNSTESNGAADLRPELCPLGKYGFDARCRDWYATGKKMWEASGASIYCNSPSLYANGLMGQSCSSPLFDPITRKHIGQTLIDFLPQAIIDSLKEGNQLKEGYPILITTQVNSFGTDTIVGPGFNLGDPGHPIEQLVLQETGKPTEELVPPHDSKITKLDCGGSNDNDVVRSDFKDILGRMRAGNSGWGCFTRKSKDNENDNMLIFYAPVTAKTSLPMDSSDFSRGIQENKTQIFSLALVQPKSSIIAPFQTVNDFIKSQVILSIGVLSALILVGAVLVVFISFRVTESIITPVMQLLTVVQLMNR